MKGALYSCEWLGDPEYGTMPVQVYSRTRALWVPEAGILIQWVLPNGTMQVSRPKMFPPGLNEARTSFLGDRNVPYAVILEARRYLKDQQSRIERQKVLQQAQDRITDSAVRSEGRLQAVAGKLLRDQPDSERGKPKK